MQRTRLFETKLTSVTRFAVVLGCLLVASTALAGPPWTGKIARISMRNGYSDTYLGTAQSQHDIVIHSSSSSTGNIVCVVEEGTGMLEHFLSIATAAMLAGLTVTLERHGNAQDSYKCAWISVAR